MHKPPCFPMKWTVRLSQMLNDSAAGKTFELCGSVPLQTNLSFGGPSAEFFSELLRRSGSILSGVFLLWISRPPEYSACLINELLPETYCFLLPDSVSSMPGNRDEVTVSRFACSRIVLQLCCLTLSTHFYLFIQYLKRNTQLATIASLPCGPL